MANDTGKPRCEKELLIEKHFGFKTENYNDFIRIRFADMVDLLVAFEQQFVPKSQPAKSIDWKELREKFFKECTKIDSMDGRMVKIDITPHDLFKWFKKEMTSQPASAPAIPDEQDELKHELRGFFIWFRNNGEKHIGKSVESLIDIYMKDFQELNSKKFVYNPEPKNIP
jgi:hypothetical protein